MPEAAAGLDEMGPPMMRTTGNPRWSEGGPAGPARRDQPGGTSPAGPSRRDQGQVPAPAGSGAAALMAASSRST
jgi:hypothetical protein